MPAGHHAAEAPPILFYAAEPGDPARLVSATALGEWLGVAPEPGLRARHLHPEDRARVLQALADAGASGEGFRATYRMLAADGRVLWLRDEMPPAPPSASPGPAPRMGVLVDVTRAHELAEALEASERRRRGLTQAVGVTFVADAAGRVLEAPGWAEVSGVDPIGAAGDGWQDAVVPADLPGAVREWEAAVAAQAPIAIQHRLVARDGSERWVEVRAVPVRDGPVREGGGGIGAAEGGVVEFVGIVADIDSRRRAEAAREALLAELARGRDRLDAILGGLPVGVLVVEAPTGEVAYRNAAAARLLGGAAAPQGFAKGSPKDSPARLPEALPIARILRGEAVAGEALRLPPLCLGCPAVEALVHAGPLRDAAGRVTAGVVALADLTAQRRVETALAESEARFGAISDAAPVMIWVTGPDGACHHLNRRWYEFTGQPEGGGEGFGWLEALHAEDRARVGAIFRDAAARGTPFRAEYRLRRADGAWRWALDTAEPRFGADGTYLGFVGSVIDITDRRESEERHAVLARELDHRAKNALAVVQSVLRLTRAEDPRSFVAAVEGRVRALARAHSLLAEARWAGVDLRELAAAELDQPSQDAAGRPRARLSGPRIILAPGAVQPVVMALHELTTNALRHGALACPEGELALSWEPCGPELGGLRLHWVERGGAPVEGPPARRGFGTRLLTATLRDQLGGEVALDWRREGLVGDIHLPERWLA